MPIDSPNSNPQMHAYNGECHIEPERGKMITESKVEHIKSLITLAKNSIRKNKTAEIQKEVRNIAIGTFISIGLTMLTVYFGDSKISNVASILFWVLLIVSACMFLQSFFICKNAETEENASYIAPLDQALTIMTDFQNSMPNQNDNTQTSS